MYPFYIEWTDGRTRLKRPAGSAFKTVENLQTSRVLCVRRLWRSARCGFGCRVYFRQRAAASVSDCALMECRDWVPRSREERASGVILQVLPSFPYVSDVYRSKFSDNTKGSRPFRALHSGHVASGAV